MIIKSTPSTLPDTDLGIRKRQLPSLFCKGRRSSEIPDKWNAIQVMVFISARELEKKIQNPLQMLCFMDQLSVGVRGRL